ncbi:MAG: Flp/Fap pilin component [Frankiales bacterium]|nr:Flp/Fap pilin component [Frankiales bacterium]
MRNLRPSRADDSGATAVEYGLLVALVASVVAASVGVLGQTVLGLFSITWP